MIVHLEKGRELCEAEPWDRFSSALGTLAYFFQRAHGYGRAASIRPENAINETNGQQLDAKSYPRETSA